MSAVVAFTHQLCNVALIEIAAKMNSNCICCIITNESNELYVRYWARSGANWRESLSELGSAFASEIRELESMVTRACYAAILNIRCDLCRRPVLVSTRVQYDNWLRTHGEGATYRCGSCVRSTYLVSFPEFVDVLERGLDHIERELERRRREVAQLQVANLHPIDAFYLHCVVARLDDCDDGVELPPATAAGSIAPTAAIARQIYTRLWELGAIELSIRSPLTAFNAVSHPHSSVTFDPMKVAWFVPVDYEQTTLAAFRLQLEERARALSVEDVETLWYLLAEAECLSHAVCTSASLGRTIEHEQALVLSSLLHDLLRDNSIGSCKALIEKGLEGGRQYGSCGGAHGLDDGSVMMRNLHRLALPSEENWSSLSGAQLRSRVHNET